MESAQTVKNTLSLLYLKKKRKNPSNLKNYSVSFHLKEHKIHLDLEGGRGKKLSLKYFKSILENERSKGFLILKNHQKNSGTYSLSPK